MTKGAFGKSKEKHTFAGRILLITLLLCFMLISCNQEEKLDSMGRPSFLPPAVTLDALEGTYEIVTSTGFLPEKHLYSFSGGVITSVPCGDYSSYLDDPVVTGSYTLSGNSITMNFNGQNRSGSLAFVEDVGIELSLAGEQTIRLKKFSDEQIDTSIYGSGNIVGTYIDEMFVFDIYPNKTMLVMDFDLNELFHYLYDFQGNNNTIIHLKSYLENRDDRVNIVKVGKYLLFGSSVLMKLQ